LLERAIGVIYRPETELLSHYFQAELSRQFDTWIWFTETTAGAAHEAGANPAAPTKPILSAFRLVPPYSVHIIAVL